MAKTDVLLPIELWIDGAAAARIDALWVVDVTGTVRAPTFMQPTGSEYEEAGSWSRAHITSPDGMEAPTTLAIVEPGTGLHAFFDMAEAALREHGARARVVLGNSSEWNSMEIRIRRMGKPRSSLKSLGLSCVRVGDFERHLALAEAIAIRSEIAKDLREPRAMAASQRI